MDCIQSIQKAIKYMENHLLDKICYEDVARQLYMSNYYFHRLFSMITGMTANEYIRSRKLYKSIHKVSWSNAQCGKAIRNYTAILQPPRNKN